MASRTREHVQHYFECFCEVVKHPDGRRSVIKTFPQDYDSPNLQIVPDFVYPCDFHVQFVVEHFSFVLTNFDSKWMYGFCRHDVHTNRALVFLSYLPHHDKFYGMLDHIASLMRDLEKSHNESLINLSDDIEENDPSRLHPDVHNYLHLYFGCPPGLNQEYKLPRIPGNINLTEYYNAVRAPSMMKILSSMLHERRIIICSRRLSRVAACVQAANDLLYPLVWQHIFIPILPEQMTPYLHAPMPYLIGVHESVFERITEDLGEVVVVYADEDRITSPFKDLEGLPSDATKILMNSLKSPYLLEDVIARGFLQTITYLIAGYRDAFRVEDGQVVFDTDVFVSNRGSAMKPFLQTLSTSQTFVQFIDDRMKLLQHGTTRTDEFERECCAYDQKKLEAGSRGFPNLSKLYESLHHPSKIFRQVRDKAHPAVESAVESVKSGRRGVRSAYKDLRNKLENLSVDNSPRSSRSRSTARNSNKRVGNFETIEELDTPSSESVTTTAVLESGSLDKTYAVASSSHSSPRFREKLTISPPINFGPDDLRNAPVSRASLGSRPSSLSPLFPPPILAKFEVDLKTPLVPRTSMGPPLTPLSPLYPSPILKKETMVEDLIKLNEPQTDTDLLKEYGLDLNRFRLSRSDWTTFD
ncbi:DENN domain-containing protein 1B isoform X2 [Arctopsyche grandis]|uniref:DENN domain-containing protein 1B isoform X2 n=1 Tax=Arctopsyche grandis TaxID=121162 RepID=UPI00406D8B6E